MSKKALWAGKTWCITENGIEELKGGYSVSFEEMFDPGWLAHIVRKGFDYDDFEVAWLTAVSLFIKREMAHAAKVRSEKARPVAEPARPISFKPKWMRYAEVIKNLLETQGFVSRHELNVELGLIGRDQSTAATKHLRKAFSELGVVQVRQSTDENGRFIVKIDDTEKFDSYASR